MSVCLCLAGAGREALGEIYYKNAVIAAAAIELLSLRQRLLLRLPSLPGVETLTVRPSTAGLLGVLGWALGPPPPLAERAAG